MSALLDFFLHLDRHIQEMIQHYGPQTYAFLFFIIFAETGFVVTPFLPGDSLLFAVGMFCRPEEAHSLNIGVIIPLLALAAIAGDQVNYRLGAILGPRVFKNDNAKIFKKSYLLKTEAFFERHGAKAIIMARFVPIVRTFAPFVAGMGDMSYKKFCLNSVVGAFLWVAVCSGAGYLFGQIPAVKEHFELGILGLIAVSIVPMIFEYAKHKRKHRAQLAEKQSG
jgi:membrane-associated protein